MLTHTQEALERDALLLAVVDIIDRFFHELLDGDHVHAGPGARALCLAALGDADVVVLVVDFLYVKKIVI